MKRIAALLAIALGTGMFMCAEDKSKGNEMTGTICDQKCVRQDAGKAACDLSCTETGGDAIFVDDQGEATKVANPAICEGKMGKKVKVHGKMMKNKDMQIYDVGSCQCRLVWNDDVRRASAFGALLFWNAKAYACHCNKGGSNLLTQPCRYSVSPQKNPGDSPQPTARS